MISLVETGLTNALLAVVLALPVLALGRICHRPALVHAFWILVLLKLIAPPLYLIPVSVSLPARTPVMVRDGHTLPTPTIHPAVSHTHSSPPTGDFAATLANFDSWTMDWQIYATYGLQFMQQLAWPILVLWLLGSVGWFAWQGWSVVRFTQVFLRYARRGPPVLQNLAQRLAQQMGIPRAPEVWLLPAVVSPMLWSVGGKPRILFPRDLLSRLDEGAVATLLTHELAHYRRGDHRVRLLEFLASGLFWWHPVLWLARRELEISEEKCCDAWVVSQFPAAQRQYADALLATVDFLTETHPPLPATACGLGEVPLLRQRLKLIMRGTAPKSLSLVGRAAVLATAMLIPISPSLQLREPPTVQAASSPMARADSIVSDSRFGTSPRHQARSTVSASFVPTADSQLPPVQVSVATEVPQVTTATESACGPNARDIREGAKPVPTPTTSPRKPQLALTASQFIFRMLGQSEGPSHPSAPGFQDLLDLATCHKASSLILADGTISLTGSRDGAIRVWNLQSPPTGPQLVPDLQAALHGSACDLTPGVSDSENSDIRDCWGVDEVRTIERVTMSLQGCQSLSLSPRGLTLVTSSDCFTRPAVLLARFTSEGKLLLATEWRGLLVTWNLGTDVRMAK